MDYYNFYSDGKRKVICTTEFAGKKFRGVAKCSPNDAFDLEKGKEVALARCRLKFATYRRDLMKKYQDEMLKNLLRAKRKCEEAKKKADKAAADFLSAYLAKLEIEKDA